MRHTPALSKPTNPWISERKNASDVDSEAVDVHSGGSPGPVTLPPFANGKNKEVAEQQPELRDVMTLTPECKQELSRRMTASWDEGGHCDQKVDLCSVVLGGIATVISQYVGGESCAIQRTSFLGKFAQLTFALAPGQLEDDLSNQQNGGHSVGHCTLST